jgi:hypothetical protein
LGLPRECILGHSTSTKNKEKKERSKQTTLFAMLPKTAKSSRTTKSDSASLEQQRVIQTESQSTDVTMSEVDGLDSAMESPHETQDHQGQGSPDWEETQLDESYTTFTDVPSSEI